MGTQRTALFASQTANNIPDYGYSTTTYGAQGGADGGGFMQGSQNDSPNAKRSYGKDSLRPVTIKQLVDAHHPHADAEHFMIDQAEATQVTFVGQIRNISKQTTNVTYKLDDGTGIMEVKVWIDAEAYENPDKKPEPVEQAYVRVWGRLKQFNNKRHVGATIVRPIQDFNEIQYHLLEATVVHLHFTKGPPESLQAKGGANGVTNGGNQQSGTNGQQLPKMTPGARRVLKCISDTPQTNEGMHMQVIAGEINMEISEVMKAGDELQGLGLVYTTVDDHTWALLDV